jgi:hypothetical protein
MKTTKIEIAGRLAIFLGAALALTPLLSAQTSAKPAGCTGIY